MYIFLHIWCAGSLYPEEVMMKLSPSYQSELSDCSFFPPTHSSLNQEAAVQIRPHHPHTMKQQPLEANGYFQHQVKGGFINYFILWDGNKN